eukprot:scaffold2028_cov181-Ochromonas_danica.AAC.32
MNRNDSVHYDNNKNDHNHNNNNTIDTCCTCWDNNPYATVPWPCVIIMVEGEREPQLLLSMQ